MANVLDIKGTSQTSFTVGKGGVTLTLDTSDGFYGKKIVLNGDIQVNSGFITPGAMRIGTTTAQDSIQINSSASNSGLLQLRSGKVGINNGNPTATLDVIGTIAASGVITGSNLSGTNTGDQTITLTGDITGSGTNSFSTTLNQNVIRLATTSLSGFLSASDKTKLDGISPGAEVNQNTFSSFTDGTTTSTADSTTDTFRLRTSDTKLNIVITNDDPTFGDNALFSINEANLNLANMGGVISDTQHGSRGGGALHSVATTGVAGFMSASDKSKLDGVASGAQPNQNAYSSLTDGTTTASAGNSTDTLKLRSANNKLSIAVGSNDATHGDNALFTINEANLVLSNIGGTLSDIQHGARGGGTLHADATTTVDGFMSAADKVKLDGIASGAEVNANVYTSFGDGTNQTLAEAKNDLFRFRSANNLLTVLVTNNQATFGDNALFTVNEANITLGNLSGVLPISKGGTGQSVRTFVDTSSTETIGGVKSFSAGSLNLTSTTSNMLTYTINGTGTPTFTTRSIGTKIVLYPVVNATSVDYGIGVGGGTFWNSIPQFSTANKFSWYGGQTEVASLRGDGLLTTTSLVVNTVNAWTAPTLPVGWTTFTTGYPAASYRKLPDGTVEFKGMIKKSTAIVAGETLFTLPAGFRPAEIRVYCTISNNTLGRLDVTASGAVQVQQGSSSWFSLEGIRFVAEA